MLPHSSRSFFREVWSSIYAAQKTPKTWQERNEDRLWHSSLYTRSPQQGSGSSHSFIFQLTRRKGCKNYLSDRVVHPHFQGRFQVFHCGGNDTLWTHTHWNVIEERLSQIFLDRLYLSLCLQSKHLDWVFESTFSSISSHWICRQQFAIWINFSPSTTAQLCLCFLYFTFLFLSFLFQILAFSLKHRFRIPWLLPQ